jgi:DNA (cytosine-5)-methyltransferase 1
VFVVASSRDDINLTEILFEFEGLRRDTPQSRKEGKVTPTISSSGTRVSRVGFNCEDEWFIETPVCGALDTECGGTKMNHQTIASGHIFPVKSFYESSLAQYREATLSGTIKASGGVAGGGSETFLAQSIPGSVYENHPSDSRVKELGDVSSTVRARWGTGGGNAPMVSQPVGTDLYNCTITGDISMTLKRGDGNPAINQPTVMQTMAVRRLTPVECERLQGFPDNYTNIPWRKAAESPDGPRYKALGNSWAVPVVAWIGKRIQDQLQ